MKQPVGRVYILSNKAMPGLLKIGYTMNTVEGRVRELSIATGVPSEFVIEYQVECRDPVGVEAFTHSALDEKRYNKGREFFTVSLGEAVQVIRQAIRSNADDIFEEEFLDPADAPEHSWPTLLELRTQRDGVKDWYDVANLYWRVRVCRSSIKWDKDIFTLWQMISVHDNKKMKEYQSVVSMRRYNIVQNNFEPIYDCFYSLPLCTGAVVNEIVQSEKAVFPVKRGSPAQSIINAVKLWT
jgi:hypothetical protein